jgi:hypothetical protein
MLTLGEASERKEHTIILDEHEYALLAMLPGKNSKKSVIFIPTKNIR